MTGLSLVTHINKIRNNRFGDVIILCPSIPQPLEIFFTWLFQRTDIQSVSNVRLLKGLPVDYCGRLANARCSPLLYY
jgi:hypothetical protein